MVEATGFVLPAVSIAVVDDDLRVAEIIALHLQDLGCAVCVFGDPLQCRAAMRETPADILITDLDMPGLGGLDLMRDVRQHSPATEVIVVTGNADKGSAIEALKLGAFDFFEKPVDRDELIETVKRTVRYRQAMLDRARMSEELSAVSRREAAKWGIDAFVGQSEAIRKVLADVRRLQAALRTAVLISGESGTGKELVARAVHFGSARGPRPFIPVNCSAIPSELAESVLFGHIRGAFTGAAADSRGCFLAADGGTVFLDEIGDMPAMIQVKLLRVLEDGIVTRVGETTGAKVDVRVIAATNADLNAKIASGAFRRDLYFRLAGFTVDLPPLRDRVEDIPPIMKHFVSQLSTEMGFPEPEVDGDVAVALCRHAFPGNVRELRNLMERALIESGGAKVTRQHLRFLHAVRPGDRPPPAPSCGAATAEGDLPLNLARAESLLIRRAMEQAGGNVSAAARLLGINRTKLYRKLPSVDRGDAC